MKYAYFDSTAPQPAPVLGWYLVKDKADPDGFDYPSLPAASDLLTLTKLQWVNRLNTPYVKNGALIAAPGPTLAQVQATQIASLAASYSAAIAADIAYTSVGGTAQTYQADAGSVSNLNYMLQAYTPAGATPAGFYWVAADNTPVPFTLTDLQDLAKALADRGWSAFQNLQKKKAKIKAATTMAKITAVTW